MKSNDVNVNKCNGPDTIGSNMVSHFYYNDTKFPEDNIEKPKPIKDSIGSLANEIKKFLNE